MPHMRIMHMGVGGTERMGYGKRGDELRQIKEKSGQPKRREEKQEKKRRDEESRTDKKREEQIQSEEDDMNTNQDNARQYQTIQYK